MAPRSGDASRAALHDRADHHSRDDSNWLKHTLWYKMATLEYKPVHMKPLTARSIEPKIRTY